MLINLPVAPKMMHQWSQQCWQSNGMPPSTRMSWGARHEMCLFVKRALQDQWHAHCQKCAVAGTPLNINTGCLEFAEKSKHTSWKSQILSGLQWSRPAHEIAAEQTVLRVMPCLLYRLLQNLDLECAPNQWGQPPSGDMELTDLSLCLHAKIWALAMQKTHADAAHQNTWQE